METAASELTAILSGLAQSVINKESPTDTQTINKVLNQLRNQEIDSGQLSVLVSQAAAQMAELQKVRYPNQLQLAVLMRLGRIHKGLLEIPQSMIITRTAPEEPETSDGGATQPLKRRAKRQALSSSSNQLNQIP